MYGWTLALQTHGVFKVYKAYNVVAKIYGWFEDAQICGCTALQPYSVLKVYKAYNTKVHQFMRGRRRQFMEDVGVTNL